VIRLLVLDVEGVITLAGGSQYPWPLKEMLAVRRALVDAAFACILCTGRQVPYGEAIIQALDLFRPLPAAAAERALAVGGPALQGWPSILENGGYLYDPLAKRPFPHPAVTAESRRLLRAVREEALEPLMEKSGGHLDVGKHFCLSINPPPVCPGSRQRQPTADFLPAVEQALLPYLSRVEMAHSASAIDVTPRGVSKASALRVVIEWTGIRREEVAGVGDTGADAAWLREVGWSAAPANGREALPEVDFHAVSEATEGLLAILARLRARSEG
jgi:hydroxymethylpyrimidine pyrophosphatase-like HAD family hydrolase